MKAEIKNLNNSKEEGFIGSTYNVEIEQHILGHIITNSNSLNHVSDILKAEYFYHPLHKKIYSIIADFASKDLLISPLTIKNFIAGDKNFNKDDTVEYINKLALNSSYLFDIKEYSRIIVELALKRQLAEVGTDIVSKAKSGENDVNVVSLIEEAEQKLFNLASLDEYSSDFQSISMSLNQAL